MCMFQVQEEELGKEHDEQEDNKKVKDLVGMIGNMYKKKSNKFVSNF